MVSFQEYNEEAADGEDYASGEGEENEGGGYVWCILVEGGVEEEGWEVEE